MNQVTAKNAPMETHARDSYLVTEVMTAPPQRLHLMLIEAALRLGHQARQHWAAREDHRAAEALIRAQEIVGEMLAGLDREVDGKLVKRVAAVYLFVFRSLMEALHGRDEAKLAGALRVLQIERETWREVCERLGGAPGRDAAPAPPARAADLAPGEGTLAEPCSARLSLDA